MKKISLMFIGLACAWISAFAQPTNQDSIRLLLEHTYAQQYADTLMLSLEQAKQFAVEQNRTLKNSQFDVQKAHAQRWQTIASMLPQVDGSAQYINMCAYEMDFAGGHIVMPDYITAGVTASVGINGQAVVGALLSNLAIEMQDITLEKTEVEIRSNVLASYMAVLVMEDIVSLMDSSLQNVRVLAQQAQRMAEVGAVEQTQADQLMVRVNQLSNSVSENKRNLRLAYNALRVLLDLNVTTHLVLTNTLDQLMDEEASLGALLQQFDITDNYDYQLLAKNVEVAKKNVDMAAWAYGPTIGASYQYNYRHNLSDGGFNMTPPHMVAISFSMPIWSSGKRAAGVTEKKIALQEAQNTLDDMKGNLSIKYDQLRFNLANAYENYLTERDNKDVTGRVFDNISNKYKWGAASLLELLNASNDQITAQTTYVNSLLKFVNARVDLDNFLHNK